MGLWLECLFPRFPSTAVERRGVALSGRYPPQPRLRNFVGFFPICFWPLQTSFQHTSTPGCCWIFAETSLQFLGILAGSALFHCFPTKSHAHSNLPPSPQPQKHPTRLQLWGRAVSRQQQTPFCYLTKQSRGRRGEAAMYVQHVRGRSSHDLVSLRHTPIKSSCQQRMSAVLSMLTHGFKYDQNWALEDGGRQTLIRSE